MTKKTKQELEKEVQELQSKISEIEKKNQELETTNKELEEKVKKLEEDITNITKERDDYKDKLLRLAAEYDNAKKRLQREREEILEYANENLLKEFIEVLDNLERVFKNISEEDLNDEKFKKFYDGLKLVNESFVNILKKHGLEKIEALGKPFDPHIHDALMTQVDNSVEDNTVINVYKDGYKLKGKVIRHSQVVVSKKGEDESQKN